MSKGYIQRQRYVMVTAEERQALLDHLSGTDDKRLWWFLKALEQTEHLLSEPRDHFGDFLSGGGQVYEDDVPSEG